MSKQTNLVQTSNSFSSGFSFRNKLINGGFDIWQRGVATYINGYFADRWRVEVGFSSITRQTHTTLSGSRYNAYLERNESGTMSISQRIEASTSASLMGKDVTVSLKRNVQVGAVTTMTAVLKYPTAVDNFTTTTIIESKVFSESDGVFHVTFLNLPDNVVNGLELLLEFVVPAAAGVNISQVQLEEGEVATAFEQRPIGLELSLCQRYYLKMNCAVGSYYNGEGGNVPFSTYINFPCFMRSNPNITFQNITATLTNTDGIGSQSENGFSYQINITATGTAFRLSTAFCSAEL